jgi:hypothetical protein
VYGIPQEDAGPLKEVAEIGHVADIQNISSRGCIESDSKPWPIPFDSKRIPNVAIKRVPVFLCSGNLCPTALKRHATEDTKKAVSMVAGRYQARPETLLSDGSKPAFPDLRESGT